MCGIVGYVGARPAQELLLAGLTKLEYRGYDSAGLSVMRDGSIEAVQSVGNLEHLREAVSAQRDGEGAVATLAREATIGIGHTRWATHGRVNEQNAHPHFDSGDRVHVVVNGIVENYLALRERLRGDGAVFTSETDAEVIAHLIASHLDATGGDLADAVRAAYAELQGHYAFVAMSLDAPGHARRRAQGVPADRRASATARRSWPRRSRRSWRRRAACSTSRTVRSSSCGRARRRSSRPRATSSSVRCRSWTGTRRPPRRAATRRSCSRRSTSRRTRSRRRSPIAPCATTASISPTRARSSDEVLVGARRIVIVACGTSYHAGLIGRYAIEELARVPVEVEIASEYRYRNPIVGPGDLVIGITQSGETADTLAAMRIAKERGATVLAVSNVMGSQATRDADGVLYTRAGLEVSVAATKTFICQVAVMYLLALRLAELHGTLAPERLGTARSRAERDTAPGRGAARERRPGDRRDRRAGLAGRILPLPRAPRRASPWPTRAR